MNRGLAVVCLALLSLLVLLLTGVIDLPGSARIGYREPDGFHCDTTLRLCAPSCPPGRDCITLSRAWCAQNDVGRIACFSDPAVCSEVMQRDRCTLQPLSAALLAR